MKRAVKRDGQVDFGHLKDPLQGGGQRRNSQDLVVTLLRTEEHVKPGAIHIPHPRTVHDNRVGRGDRGVERPFQDMDRRQVDFPRHVDDRAVPDNFSLAFKDRASRIVLAVVTKV